MPKFFLKVFFILIFGVLGGIIFQAFLLPYLATISYFQKFQFIKILTEREVNIFPKETITIQENLALEEAIEKVEKTVVAIKSQTKKGKILEEGSGLILTADGMLITLAEILPQGSDFNFFWEGEKLPYQVLRRDLKNNLGLVKLEKNNLKPAAFSDFEKIRLGQKVFLVGVLFEDGKIKKIVNEGIIQSFDDFLIETNIIERESLKGSPLFNIKGELIGLAKIDKTGKVIAVSVKKIREFSGL